MFDNQRVLYTVPIFNNQRELYCTAPMFDNQRVLYTEPIIVNQSLRHSCLVINLICYVLHQRSVIKVYGTMCTVLK